MKKNAKQLTLIAFTILLSATAIAQNPGDPSTDPDASIPLDDGLVSVLLLGAGIGVVKLLKTQKNNNVLNTD